MGHLCFDGPGHRHVVKNYDRSSRRPILIMDWSGRIFDGKFSAVTSNENAVWGKSRSFVLLERRFQGIQARRSCTTVDNYKHVVDMLAGGLFPSPTSDLFGHSIEVRNSASQVDAQHRIPDGVKRHLRAFFFSGQYCSCGLPLGHVPYSTKE